MGHTDDYFFKEASLRICGSFEIEKAIQRSLHFIKEYIPVSRIVMNVYDDTTNLAEIIVLASLTEAKCCSIKIPYTPEVKKNMENYQSRSKRIWRVKRLGSYDGTKILAGQFETQDYPSVIMDLIIDTTIIGKISILHEKNTKYTDEHLRLLKLLNKPLALALSNYLRYREIQKLKDIARDDSIYYQEELNKFSDSYMIGADAGLKAVMENVHRVAHQDSPVLLIGETGVGKEVIAKAIHRISGRRNKPFIGVNCGAIPETLMDSELFGHEEGAFTGASIRKRGRFERAQQGTIFLDEVGELKKDAQVRLLRVLQEKEIERVGGTESIPVDIRVIAATHRNLEEMLQNKQFREDLYFRLKVFPIYIPPLRERILDIPALVSYFIQKKSMDMKLGSPPVIGPGQIDLLMEYAWPGNVRELENSVERALILYNGKQLIFEGIETYKQSDNISVQARIERAPSYNLDEAMSAHIKNVLNVTKGKIHGPGGAAELLGVNSMTLRHRLKKLGIPFGRKANKQYNEVGD